MRIQNNLVTILIQEMVAPPCGSTLSGNRLTSPMAATNLRPNGNRPIPTKPATTPKMGCRT
jgi:hypothetical protein